MPRPISPARSRAIGRALRRVERTTDRGARLATDPLGVVRARYSRAPDLEIAGLVGACLAFGNVKTLCAKVSDAFDRLGPELARTADDELETFARMAGFVHRVYRGEDVARLVIGARRVQRASRTLGAYFEGELRARGALRPALEEFARAVREAGGLDKSSRRGAAHLLPDPGKASACKRLLLYLRWMVRSDDVDLGLWRDRVPAAALLVPVDTHVLRLSQNLGFTSKRSATWLAAEEITVALGRYDRGDPVRFDFPLCHLGIARRCPSRRDPVRCEGCGLREVCRHW